MRLVLFGENSLRRACDAFVEHYHHERAHQWLGNQRVERGALVGAGKVECSERFGEISNHYRRAA